MSAGKVQFDVSEFQREFQKRVARSRKSLAEVVNWTAFRILQRLLKITPRASRQDIMRLGTAKIEIFGKRGKRLKKQRHRLIANTRFRAIFAAQLRRRGINPRKIGKGEFDTKMNAALGRRVSSIGFVASGWLKAIKKIVRALAAGGSFADAPKNFPQAKGDAIPAKENSWNPVAEFSNSTAMNFEANSEQSKQRVEQHLLKSVERAFSEELDDFRKHTEEAIDRAMQGN